MSSTIDERDWAAKTAMRLRIVQATKVESESQDRGREVWEFISQAMQELAQAEPGQRRRCMQALDEEFPFFESRPSRNGESQPDPPRTESGGETVEPASKPRPATVDELIDDLVVAAGALTDAERAQQSKRLFEAGFRVEQTHVRDSQGGLQAAVALPVYDEEHLRLKRTVERILDRVGAGKEGGRVELNLTRCMQMIGLMSDQYLLLHPQVWELWDHLAATQHFSTSFNRPTLLPAKALGDFLQGKSSTRRTDVGEMVTKTFYLLNALVTAVSEAGNEFAAWFFQKFGPDNIQSLIQFETDSRQAGPAEFWKRYCELTQHVNEAEMKEQFQSLLGKAMLRFLQRRPGTPG